MPVKDISETILADNSIPDSSRYKSSLYCSKGCFKKIKGLSALTNNDNRSKIIEESVNFYFAYISGQLSQEYLCGIYGKQTEAQINALGDRMASQLFKIAVNDNMMAALIASMQQLSPDDYQKMRSKAVQDVKSTTGVVDLYKAMNEHR